MLRIRLALSLVLSLFATSMIAGVNPVSWTLTPAAGFSDVIPGEAATVVYTLTVHPQFPGPVTLKTEFTDHGTGFSITDTCNNKLISPGASCTITIDHVPIDTSRSSIQMNYRYNDNLISLPTLSVSGSKENEGLVGSMSGLPTIIRLTPFQTPIIMITYTNQSSANITGYAGDSSGNNLFTALPTSVATIAVVPGENTCGTVDAPVTITPGQSCTIQAQITPVDGGSVTITGIFTYNSGRTTASSTNTTTVSSTPGQCLSGEATLPFQSPTLQYADNVLQFTYSNSCGTPTSTLGTVAFTPSGTSTSPTVLGNPYNASFDNCSGQSIGAHSSCTVLVSVIPQNTGTLTVTASVDGVEATSSTTVNAPSYAHNVTFVNQCGFPVWYGVTTPSGSSDPTPSPSPSAYLLPAQAPGVAPATKTISFGANSYFGTFLPRTGCVSSGSSFTCATGDCVSGANAQCSGTAYEPFTRVEEVFPSSTTQGNYDVSLENGPTVPAEFKGLGPSTNQTASPAASFVCSGAGAPIPIPFYNPPYLSDINLGSCPWTYSVPNTPSGSSPLYYFVTNDTTVTSCSGCTSPNVCGLAYQTTPENQNIVLACGRLLGYWTLTQMGTVNYVGSNAAYDPATVFEFSTLLTSPSFQSGYPSGTNAYDLYSCTPQGTTLTTCYPSVTSPSTTLCCGAHDWNATNGFSPYLTAQSSNSTAQNPDWLSTSALPITPYESILWLKNACPTAYSYQFDDPSVSFNCNNQDASQTEAVAMDFEVVFCPGGLSSNLSTNP